MSNDVECPYCDKWQEINHDDGYGYDESITYEQQCSDCEKFFTFTTFIDFSYDADKAPCLNGGSHNWRPVRTYPKWYTRARCFYCDDVRDLTDQEWLDLMEPMECVSGW